jgi:ketosteroid isomerase-like protein
MIDPEGLLNMIRLPFVVPVLSLFLVAACAREALPTPDPIVSAEHAFAAEGYKNGVKKSFLAYAAADGIIFNPGPVNAHEVFEAAPDEDLAEPRAHLVWWPLYAGIARSGDLGFTTGPYAIDDNRRGHYFTVWKKQPDGAWKWLLDAGVAADASGEAGQGSPVSFLPASASGSASPEAALKAVAALEEKIAEGARTDLKSAYGEFLETDSRFHSAGAPPAKTEDNRDAALAVRPGSLDFRALGGGASEAGDLVWTYGEGRLTKSSIDTVTDQVGHYVRVWQKRRAGWRLVFDEYLPPPDE